MTPYLFQNNVIGHTFPFPNGYVFFGNRFGSLEILQKAFPEIQFCFLKQVHGRQIVKQPAALALSEADGHWTERFHLGLMIKTADCYPIFWTDGNAICALHAGWRGVAQNIVQASCQLVPAKPLSAFLGPAILGPSFEVGLDVAETILGPFSKEHQKQYTYPHPDPKKAYIDLKKIIEKQFRDHNSEVQIQDLDHNTLLDTSYFSYRRQAEEAGRNLSFIVKVPQNS
ncbi:MAG: polyphenol oxidase family protein [Bdellovibrionales bacterium]|nr:polyphenol oxidase family protein [Bdellovibrionales bacterium]